MQLVRNTLTLPGIVEESTQLQQSDAAPWGVLTSIDIYECNAELIRDAEHVKRFVVELCDLIDMRRYGECQVVHFGTDPAVAGYSVMQLIETSIISGHFAEQSNSCYLDIFSCKPYQPQKAADFAIRHFQGKRSRINILRRW